MESKSPMIEGCFFLRKKMRFCPLQLRGCQTRMLCVNNPRELCLIAASFDATPPTHPQIDVLCIPLAIDRKRFARLENAPPPHPATASSVTISVFCPSWLVFLSTVQCAVA